MVGGTLTDVRADTADYWQQRHGWVTIDDEPAPETETTGKK